SMSPTTRSMLSPSIRASSAPPSAAITVAPAGRSATGTKPGPPLNTTTVLITQSSLFALEADETDDGGRLDSGFVAPLLLALRLIRLDGGAARSVLLCLAARVFEGGAGVGVDELPCLDPLETVSF